MAVFGGCCCRGRGYAAAQSWVAPSNLHPSIVSLNIGNPHSSYRFAGMERIWLYARPSKVIRGTCKRRFLLASQVMVGQHRGFSLPIGPVN